ncbi:MFS transporter [Kutzneria sp. NPDC051319]|uniref:MFS transporter n=1 Tax=Kutzneria sp. NPDC051319 TaxID=3155047 RepID=UPI003422228B
MDSQINGGRPATAEPARPAAGGGPWRVFWVLALIEFMSVMDASVVNIALPSIQHNLGFSPTTIAWVVNGYVVGFAGFMLLAGKATDIVGRKRLFVAGVAMFAVFSLACAAAQQPWQLVLFRLLQGIGAALVTPAALALITDIFPEGPQRNKAIGMFSGMAGVAAPVGLVLGGLLTTAAWQWIFLINGPIGLIVLVAAIRLLPSTVPSGGGSLDVIGAVTATGGLVLLILATVGGSAQGWTSAATLGEYAGALVLLVAFVVRQRTAARPMIPTVLLGRRSIVFGNTIFALVGTILIGTFFLITLFLQKVEGFGSTEAALIYLPVPIGMLLGTQVAPRLLGRGPHNVLMLGLLVQTVALAAWALTISEHGSVVMTFVVPATVWSFGLGMSIVSSFVVCTMGLDGPIAGAASGLATTTYQAGGALGLAVLAVVADSRTEHNLAIGAPDGPLHALVVGYSTALWCAAGVALVGALLTRLIMRRSAAAA